MSVRRLSLAGFRSYTALDALFPPGPQVIVGANAAGKTNLVEALVVCSRGRSHRASADAEMVGWTAGLARIEAELDPGPVVEVVLAKPGGLPGARKRVRVNGVPRRTSVLPATFRTVLFAPEEMLLVTGSPTLRRDALDDLVAGAIPGAAAVQATYARAVTQRNMLLRRIREEAAGRDELPFWDRVVVTEGGRLVRWRTEVLDALAAPLAAAHAEIAPGEGRLHVEVRSNAPALPGESPEDALRRRLTETAEKEVWNGATLVGPHRDDLVFLLDERELAGFASRGQQRTAILAWKLAELDLLTTLDGRPPLLLLDDVFSELDPDRRAHLVRRIGALPQAFVTTTTLDDLDPALVAAATAWRVIPGRLERAG